MFRVIKRVCNASRMSSLALRGFAANPQEHLRTAVGAAAGSNATPPPNPIQSGASNPRPESKTIDFGFQHVEYEEKAKLVKELFNRSAKNYDLLNDVVSLGAHRSWKNELARRLGNPLSSQLNFRRFPRAATRVLAHVQWISYLHSSSRDFGPLRWHR